MGNSSKTNQVDNSATKFAYIFYEYDKRLSTNENMLLNAFSYVYNNVANLREENIVLTQTVDSLKQNIVELEKLIRTYHPITKPKRPLWYRICKPFKYWMLLKKKHKLDEEIRIENERKAEERRIAEEARKAEEARIAEEKRKAEEAKQAEAARLKAKADAEKRKKRQEEINRLMKTKKNNKKEVQ